MKLFPRLSPNSLRSRGFSMIEIAIALGVIGFALVAIVGILPIGLNVQRDNRAETIINQDATYWLEAIRNGAQGIEDLAGYVEQIVLANDPSNPYVFGTGGLGAHQYAHGSNVISLLTQPYSGTNVTLYVHAISGAAGEKGSEVGFTYRMVVDIISATDPAIAGTFNKPPPTLYDVRLAFSWPVTQPNVPPKTSRPPLLYRTLISRNVATNDILGSSEFYHFTP